MNLFTLKNVIGFLIVITLISGVFVGVRLVQQQTQLKSKAVEAGTCRDNPVDPPSGYKWEANCSGQVCADNSQCPSGANNQEGWCYGFEDGAKCLKLVSTGNVGVAQAPTSCDSINLSKSQATPGELINVTLHSSSSSYNTIYALPATSLLASQIGTGSFLVTAPPTPGVYQIVVNTYTNDCSYFCDHTGHWKRNTSLNAGGGCPATAWEDIGECTNNCKANLTVVTTPTPGPGTPTTPAGGPTCTVDLKVNGSNGPVTVDNDATVTLSWTSQNADRVNATGAWSGSKSTSGSEATSALSGPISSTFSLTCFKNNSSQTSLDSVQVNVRGAGATPTTPAGGPVTPTPTPTSGSSCDYDILDRDGKSVKAGPIYENDRYTFKITMQNTAGDWTNSTHRLQALGNTASLWNTAQTYQLPKDRVPKDTSVVFNVDTIANPILTLDKNFEDRPTSFSMADIEGPFGASCPLEVRVSRKPAGLVSTKCYVISENPNEVNNVFSCDDLLAKQYTTHPTMLNYTFKDQSPGKKFIYVKFFDIGNRSSNTITKIVTYSPNPAISNIDCTYDSGSGLTTTYNITGSGFGLRNVNSRVRVSNQDATILTWGSEQVVARVDQRVEGATPVRVALEDGRSADSSCAVGTTTATLSVKNQCLSGQFDIDNVEVKIFSSGPEPFARQTIKTDKDGNAQGFTPKLEKNKSYSMIVKAPGTLAKRVVFSTTLGTSVVGPIVLPAGNIAPSPVSDNIINSFDVNALYSQWSLTKDVSRPADLNRDGRVNSVDYACMKLNFNKQDEAFTPPVVVSPTPSPSPSPSPTPVCAQVITAARNPAKGECREFPTPCDVPAGWVKVSSC